MEGAPGCRVCDVPAMEETTDWQRVFFGDRRVRLGPIGGEYCTYRCAAAGPTSPQQNASLNVHRPGAISMPGEVLVLKKAVTVARERLGPIQVRRNPSSIAFPCMAA